MEKKRKLPAWAIEEEEDLTHAQEGSHIVVTAEEEGEEEEEDYLNMTIEDPGTRRKGATQVDGVFRTKPRAESSQASAPASKAMKMMQKMGYVSGQALGPDGKGITEALRAHETSDRGGLGLEAQRVRETQKRVQCIAKEIQEEETGYRDAVRSELEEAQLEGRIVAAMKICETLDARARDAEGRVAAGAEETVNVLWRKLSLQRREKERASMMRQQMLDAPLTFSKREYHEDAASPQRRTAYDAAEEEEGEDDEVAAFEQLDAGTRLERLLEYLRERQRYCFWCGCGYEDAEELRNCCPGLTEAAHA